VLCVAMIIPVVIDIITQALRGDVVPALIIGVYIVAGVLIYATYGSKHSTLRRGQDAGRAAESAPLGPAGEFLRP
jgi:hypothetical protein